MNNTRMVVIVYLNQINTNLSRKLHVAIQRLLFYTMKDIMNNGIYSNSVKEKGSIIVITLSHEYRVRCE